MSRRLSSRRLPSRRLLALAAALALLVGADAGLRHERALRRAEAGTLRLLVDPARQIVPDRVRRLRLRVPGEAAEWVYERRGATWRFPAYFGAYAYGDRVESLLGIVLATAGTLASVDEDDVDDLGVGERQALRVAVDDAGGQALVEVWFGRAVPGPGGDESYARAALGDTVLRLHGNPALVVGAARPPMLDPSLLPRDEQRKAAVAARVVTSEGAAWTLRRVAAPVPADAPPQLPGAAGERYRWVLQRGSRADTCVDASVDAWLGFLRQVRFQRLVDPGADGYGFGAGARVELTDEDGARDVLEVGLQAAPGERYVRNAGAGLATVVAAERARWLTPSAATLLDSLPRPSPFADAPQTGAGP